MALTITPILCKVAIEKNPFCLIHGMESLAEKDPLFSKSMDHAIDSKIPAFSMELQMSMGTRYDGL